MLKFKQVNDSMIFSLNLFIEVIKHRKKVLLILLVVVVQKKRRIRMNSYRIRIQGT
jgi:hypothetical protein